MMLVIVEYDDHNADVKAIRVREHGMGHSQADKAQSREKILREAADQVRDHGLESISVGKLMRSVQLTHGGFYNHFESRTDLLAQALERALTEGRKASLAGADPQAPRSFEATLRSFLSRTHRDSRAGGCAIAALASDVSRADGRSRAVMSQHIDSFVAQIAKSLGTDDEGDAMLAVSAMIGALLLSRVQVDPKRSDALLKTVRERLLALRRSDAA
jgi:TetR/AcrR family transcriptional repressor of nem operon